MKAYEKPEIEIVRFDENVLTGVGSNTSVEDQIDFDS